jgi:hypothetical protein
MNGILRFNTNGCFANCQNCPNCGCSSTNQMQIINQAQNQSGPDPATVSNAFITEYYKNISFIGWNSVQHIFDHKCIVMLQDRNIGNEYDLLNMLSSTHIKRANYDNLRPKWLVINNNSILISVFGSMQFVLFNDNVSNVFPFSESFVLTLNTNNTVCCTHHILDL